MIKPTCTKNRLFIISILLLSTLVYTKTVFALDQFSPPPSMPPKPTSTNTTTPPIKLTITPTKSHYKRGELMSFTVQSNQNCYLTIIDFGTSGLANILFPNAAQQDNLLIAKKTRAIPNQHFDIKVTGDTGTETLWAHCSKQNKPLFKQPYDFKQHFFIPLGQATTISQFAEIPTDYDPQQEARQQVTLTIKP